MKIGIIGTRGIPNEYGGFEQFAMHFAEFLVHQGMEVVVYNSSNHPYKEKKWKAVFKNSPLITGKKQSQEQKEFFKPNPVANCVW